MVIIGILKKLKKNKTNNNKILLNLEAFKNNFKKIKLIRTQNFSRSFIPGNAQNTPKKTHTSIHITLKITIYQY